MRTILGPAATALERRGLALERAAMVTLRRDAYATPPGPVLGLAIGERTTYRPGTWLLDTFERAALGDAYPAWGGSAGLTLGAGGVTAAVGAMGMATHPMTLPRDAWAALVIGALGGDAAVGVLLRAADTPADGYRITATPTLTVVERLAAGVATSLASVATPWRAGEMLRAVWAWDQLRVYRETILVAQVTDGVRLVAGRAGLVARRAAGASATITAFLGGEARQEWLGAGFDLGDVQRALGQPATFDLTLSNVAPMGGVDRFAALLRHGLNTDGTYDLDRGAVRVLTVVDGLSPPLTAGVGVIDGVSELTEDRVRLACRGRDAFLTPQLAAGPVTYLAGPPPGGLTPLPPEPCAPSTPPVIEPGAPPPEPVDPPTVAGVAGVGPEAPPEGTEGGNGSVPPLLGGWTIRLTMRPGDTSAEPPEPEWVTETQVTPLPDPASWISDPACAVAHETAAHYVGATSASVWSEGSGAKIFGHLWQNRGPAIVGETREMYLYYFGPDIVATALVPPPLAVAVCYSPTVASGYAPAGVVGAATVETYSDLPFPGGTTYPVHGILARYQAAAIHTEADLAALHLATPTDVGSSEGYAAFLGRIETLATWDIALAPPAGSVYRSAYQDLGAALDLNVFAGPALIGIELETPPDLSAYGRYQVRVSLDTHYARTSDGVRHNTLAPTAGTA